MNAAHENVKKARWNQTVRERLRKADTIPSRLTGNGARWQQNGDGRDDASSR